MSGMFTFWALETDAIVSNSIDEIKVFMVLDLLCLYLIFKEGDEKPSIVYCFMLSSIVLLFPIIKLNKQITDS